VTVTFARATVAGLLLATLGAAVASGVLVDAATWLREWRHRPRRMCTHCRWGVAV